MTEFAEFINRLGFPIFVAVFLLIKGTKDSQNIANALSEVKTALESIHLRICDREGEIARDK